MVRDIQILKLHLTQAPYFDFMGDAKLPHGHRNWTCSLEGSFVCAVGKMGTILIWNWEVRSWGALNFGKPFVIEQVRHDDATPTTLPTFVLLK